MGMRDRNPADGWAMGSNDDGAPAGGLPPLPFESVVPADGLHVSGPALSSVEAFQERLDRLGDDVLEKSTIELRRSINAAHAQFALQVREMERRNIPEIGHRLTTTGWLKRHCHMTPTEASGTVKTARAMAHMPTVTANALDGVVPRRSVQLLGQARDRHPNEFFDQEEVFGDIATYLSVKDLSRALAHWEQQVDYPKALGDVEHQEKLRSLYLAQMMNGMGDIRGSLSPELFGIVTAVIDAKVNPTLLDADDHRTPAQRRADALGDICLFYLDHNNDLVTSGGEKPHVTVTVDYGVLTRQAEQLPEIDGIPVTPETIRQLTCDAGIIPMVLGSDSEPLDVGRKTRTIPSAMRRAIEQLHEGCTWPGCDAPLSWCDIHHITHWADGGQTSLPNLTPPSVSTLCETGRVGDLLS